MDAECCQYERNDSKSSDPMIPPTIDLENQSPPPTPQHRRTILITHHRFLHQIITTNALAPLARWFRALTDSEWLLLILLTVLPFLLYAYGVYIIFSGEEMGTRWARWLFTSLYMSHSPVYNRDWDSLKPIEIWFLVVVVGFYFVIEIGVRLLAS